jgi:hypothetical protein
VLSLVGCAPSNPKKSVDRPASVTADGETMKSDLNALKLQFGALLQEVSAALFAADPVCINLGGNTGEYDSEAGTILPRLREAHSADDVQVIVYEEFCRRFGNQVAGEIGRYEEVSAIIWEAWLRLASKSSAPIGR